MAKQIFPMFLGLLLLALAPQTASANILEVGPTHELKTPSAAAAVAQDGDIVRIEAGTYHDCAVWHASNLTIVGLGEVILRDVLCEQKAIFVVRGNDTAILSLTFANERTPGRNGAALLVLGANISVEGSHFTDNENGILTGDNVGSQIAVRGSVFERNGICTAVCQHAINVGHVQSLMVLGSKFIGQKQGHDILSHALNNQLLNDDFSDGPNGGASLALDLPDGGNLTVSQCVLQKGPQTGAHSAEISVGEVSNKIPTDQIFIDHTAFTNDYAKEVVTFLVNKTPRAARLAASNSLHGSPAQWLSGPGRVDPETTPVRQRGALNP